MNEEAQLTKHVLTYQETADYLNIHINTLYKHREIPRIRLGGKILFRRETLEKYLADLEQESCKK
jgi:excisionase family DNA binding protein